MKPSLLRTWAHVSLDAIAHNVSEIRRAIGGDCQVMAVVKADAYGHGAVAVSRLLQELHVDYLDVASLDEAMELRRAGIKTPILILGFTPAAFAPVLIENDLTQTLYDGDMAQAMSEAAAGCKRPLKVHLKIDTGMSRLGIIWRGEQTLDELLALCRLPHLSFEGLFTHLASSEVPNDSCNERQLALFTQARQVLHDAGVSFSICHCANSGAVIQYKKARFDMVRAGLLLYGLMPGADMQMDLRPAMCLQSVVSQVKEIAKGDTVSYGRTFAAAKPMRVAVVAAGYADGYPRALSSKASVMIGGHRAPILGLICMDMLMADVTDLPHVRAGDPVVLFGCDGEDCLPVSDLAALCGTISYELVCSVGKRVPRVYFRGGAEIGSTNYLLGDEEYVTLWPGKKT